MSLYSFLFLVICSSKHNCAGDIEVKNRFLLRDKILNNLVKLKYYEFENKLLIIKVSVNFRTHNIDKMLRKISQNDDNQSCLIS